MVPFNIIMCTILLPLFRVNFSNSLHVLGMCFDIKMCPLSLHRVEWHVRNVNGHYEKVGLHKCNTSLAC